MSETPRPWALHSNLTSARVVRGDAAGRGGGVAQFVHAADAEFCVRACNAHEALRAALETLVEKYVKNRETKPLITCRTYDPGEMPGEWRDALDALRLTGKP